MHPANQGRNIIQAGRRDIQDSYIINLIDDLGGIHEFRTAINCIQHEIKNACQ